MSSKDKKYEDGEVVYKGKPGDPVPEELQKMVDEGRALMIAKVENRWIGYPRTITYAMVVASALLYFVVGGPTGVAIGYGIALAMAGLLAWQFTELTKAYTRVRNMFEEHRAFSNMINKAMTKAMRDSQGTFEDEIGLSKDEDSSNTVH